MSSAHKNVGEEGKAKEKERWKGREGRGAPGRWGDSFLVTVFVTV